MPIKDILLLVVSSILLILVIFTMFKSKSLKKYHGVLNIDTSRPEADLYTIVLHEDFEDLQKKDVIRLKVNISREKRSL